MSQCYNVYLRIKSDNFTKLCKVLKNKILRGPTENINYNIGNLDLNDVKVLFGRIFIDRGNDSFNMKIYNSGTIVIYSDFDCCYGWEGLLYDIFDLMCPYLMDRSRMRVITDDGTTNIKCLNHKSIYCYG